MTKYTVRPIEPADQPVVAGRITESWGAVRVVVGHGRVVDASTLPGLIAEDDGELVGLLTYEVTGTTVELVTINAYRAEGGIGTLLLAEMTALVRSHGCTRIILMTTNDNTDAIRFYQRRGFRLRELRPGAVDQVRRIKPEIPEVGHHDIPIRDELELELPL